MHFNGGVSEARDVIVVLIIVKITFVTALIRAPFGFFLDRLLISAVSVYVVPMETFTAVALMLVSVEFKPGVFLQIIHLGSRGVTNLIVSCFNVIM